MNFESRRVFVSGASGVIGREMIPMLVENGASVMACDLKPRPEEFPPDIIFRRGDLNFITQSEIDQFNPEIFIHLAATFERSQETYEHWEENFWHNVRLSNHMMTLMRNVSALTRVVFPSSYLIYDKNIYSFDVAPVEPVKLKETDAIAPRNLTGMAKLAHEIELDFLRRFKNDNFKSACARIYRGYGKNSRDVISRWVRDLLQGKEIHAYSLDGIFDYIYAKDSAEGLLRLALSDFEGVINLGTGRSRRVREILGILGKYFPNMVVEEGTSDITSGATEASEADLTRLREFLHWEPKIDLETGIANIISFEESQIEKQRPIAFPNILITSISKKVPLINAVRNGVRKISDIPKIFGADTDLTCIGRYFVDEFWHMPELTDLSSDELVGYCRSNNIGVIIPTRDGELEFFAKNKSLLAGDDIHVMVSDYPVVKACLDKLAFSNIKELQGLVIPSSTSIETIQSDRFVVKERYGAGSVSVGLNLESEAAQAHAKTLENPIYQPFCVGYEITVDGYVTSSKQVKGIVMRKRQKVVGGESQVTSSFENSRLQKTFIDILQQLSLMGHITLQAIIDEHENVHLIECNPRIGGASMLSIFAGLESFYWFYAEALGEDLRAYPFLPASKPITLVRYPNDIFL